MHDLERLRDAITRFRDRARTADSEIERHTLSVSTKSVLLCEDRRVLPLLVGRPFVCEVVIPPAPRPMETDSMLELVRVGHGPVVIDCEYGCATFDEALALVKEAQKVSVMVRGWAPLYVRMWQEILKP